MGNIYQICKVISSTVTSVATAVTEPLSSTVQATVTEIMTLEKLENTFLHMQENSSMPTTMAARSDNGLSGKANIEGLLESFEELLDRYSTQLTNTTERSPPESSWHAIRQVLFYSPEGQVVCAAIAIGGNLIYV